MNIRGSQERRRILPQQTIAGRSKKKLFDLNQNLQSHLYLYPGFKIVETKLKIPSTFYSQGLNLTYPQSTRMRSTVVMHILRSVE